MEKNGFSMKNPPRQKWFFFRQKLFLQLAGKITIKSIFATTKQVRNIVIEIEILICVIISIAVILCHHVHRFVLSENIAYVYKQSKCSINHSLHAPPENQRPKS